MKKVISVIALLAIIFTLAFSLTACNKEKSIPVIGISQYGEHPSLDNCRFGFLKGLEDAGLKEGEDFTVLYQNAGFDDNVTIQIGQNFSAKNTALMCAIATNSATACYAAAEDKDIPVVFVACNDPVGSKLVGGNITGVSDALPVEAQLDLIRNCQPDAKTIGIIYTTSESNSVSTIAAYKAVAGDYGFEIVDIGITSQAEVTQAVDTLISKKVDCISNLTDNTVVGVLASILDKTNAAKIPVYGSEVEQVKIGCVAAAGIDYYELGRQSGQMAAKVLKGEAKASDIPFETVGEYGIYKNTSALNEMGVTIPDALNERAIEANEEG